MSDSGLPSHVVGKDLLWKEWQLANQIAHRFEQAIIKQFLASLDDPAGTSEPSPTDVSEAARLRGVADDLFAAAMAQTKTRAEANRRY